MRGIRTIGAHWYSRPATLKECTEQSLNFLKNLEAHNSLLFGVWFKKGGSRKQALLHQVEFSYDCIKKLFIKRGGNDDIYPEISYSFGLWNGTTKDEEATSLSVSLGSAEAKYFTNNCILNLPYEGEQHEFYKVKRNQEDLIKLLKEHWNPDWIMRDEERLEFS